jgi:hypothetical protein
MRKRGRGAVSQYYSLVLIDCVGFVYQTLSTGGSLKQRETQPSISTQNFNIPMYPDLRIESVCPVNYLFVLQILQGQSQLPSFFASYSEILQQLNKKYTNNSISVHVAIRDSMWTIV